MKMLKVPVATKPADDAVPAGNDAGSSNNSSSSSSTQAAGPSAVPTANLQRINVGDLFKKKPQQQGGEDSIVEK